MKIDRSSALELEMIVRKVYSCERFGMGGYINSDHFSSEPFDAALIALSPLWQNDDSTLVEDFLFKWEHAFRNDSQSTCDIKAYIQELGTIVDSLSKK